jgi:serine/threonine protein kinase
MVEARKNLRLIGAVYQVGQMISTGPMLTTYTAYNRNTSDVVGLLVFELPPTFQVEAALRLLEPLERRRLFQSPHVMHVFDWGIDGSRAFIATDSPRGISLRDILDSETIDLRRTVEMAMQIARGLITLQAQNIENTDIRPQLITIDMVGDSDRVQIDDVGIRNLLKQLGYKSNLLIDDIGFFDPRYLSPECIRGEQIGPWSDVYQVGLLLFELITGRVPFVGRTSAETSSLQCNNLVPRMAQFRPNVPQELQDLVDRALAKEPAQRFLNAEALMRAIKALPKVQTSMNSLLHPSVDEMPADLQEQDTIVENTPGAEEEEVYAYLYFENDGNEAQQFAISDKYVVVGRADPKRGVRPEVDLSSIDPGMTVSRQHARIRFENTFFSIEDLKSRNKTRIGELVLTPLKTELLRDGDVLHFGSVQVVFKVPGHKK